MRQFMQATTVFRLVLFALAGLFIGNFVITYPLSRWGFNRTKQTGNCTSGFFFYWFCVASVGNLIDYVPIRTFATDGDMHTLARGLNCSPWLIIIVLGIPFALILAHFIVLFAPRALHWLFPHSAGRRATMVVLTAFALFGFYGAAGLGEGDPISHMMSVVSIFAFIPISIVLGLWLTDGFWLKRKI